MELFLLKRTGEGEAILQRWGEEGGGLASWAGVWAEAGAQLHAELRHLCPRPPAAAGSARTWRSILAAACLPREGCRAQHRLSPCPHSSSSNCSGMLEQGRAGRWMLPWAPRSISVVTRVCGWGGGRERRACSLQFACCHPMERQEEPLLLRRGAACLAQCSLSGSAPFSSSQGTPRWVVAEHCLARTISSLTRTRLFAAPLPFFFTTSPLPLL